MTKTVISGLGITLTIERPSKEGVIPPTADVMVASDDEVRDIARRVKDAFPAREQVELVRMVCLTNYFTTAQVIHILQNMSFDKERVTALPLLCRRIKDRNNMYKLIMAFDFSSGKELASKIIREEIGG